ncbi:MAG: hypothetical protein IKQ35_05270 [Bacilli bacterium]|nr:hypothetical protein [Bacilli bacterium]
MRKKKNKKKIFDYRWVFIVTVLAFLISVLLSSISESIIPNAHLSISIILIIVFILLGVIFDMIGVASTTADSSVFHAMSARGIKSSKVALKLINNSAKVSSLCCDVIGDICGVISGSCAAAISVQLISKLEAKGILISVVITSFTAALTIGGKALGKGYAVNKSNVILEKFSKILYPFMGR